MRRILFVTAAFRRKEPTMERIAGNSRAVPRSFALVMVVMLAAGLAAVPARSAASPGPSGAIAPGRESGTRLEDLSRSGSYYAPDVAARYNPRAAELEELMKENCPEELLPASLRPGRESVAPDAGIAGTAGEDTGEGTGGWTALKKMYEPSPDPNITYDLYGGYTDNYLIDINGAQHNYYQVKTGTDISQPPDAAGFRFEPLARQHYQVYTEGSWSAPVNLTPTGGLQDTWGMLFETDEQGYVHFIYSRWDWGRNPLYGAGDPGAYKHYNENLYYRRRSPDGTWSDPRALTSETGNREILGGEFIIVNGKIYGSWLSAEDKGTLPISYTARVMFVEGAGSNWSAPKVVNQWDFTFAPGQKVPAFGPTIDVSPVTGEVAVAFGTNIMNIGGPQADIYGATRSAGGAWSGAANLTSVSVGEGFMGFMLLYDPDGIRCTMLAIKVKIPTGPASGPRENIYLIRHTGGGWQSALNVTRNTDEHAMGAMDMFRDEWGRWRFLVASETYEWDAGLATWKQTGDRLRYTREAGSSMSDFQDILGYAAGRFVRDAWMSVDGEGNVRALYLTNLTDPDNGTDYKVYYTDNKAGAFSTPVKLSTDSGQKIDYTLLSVNPGGSVLASWFEYRFGPGGTPQEAALYSRRLAGGSWGARKNATAVPGGEIVHIVDLTAYVDLYYAADWNSSGEQMCLFETASLKKYYSETVNGVWGSAQLVSSSTAGGYPGFRIDANARVHALFRNYDLAGKDTLYVAMQRKPSPPAATYFFAEGTTRAGFQEWLCLQNPGGESADVELTYMLGTGENKVQDVTIAPHSRITVDVNLFVGAGQDVSTRVTADRLIVAERPMYFSYGESGWPGGHDALGSVDTARVWYFAEGTTRSEFAEYLTLQNPSGADADVKVTYMLGDGSTSEQEVLVPAHSRATVDVKSAVGEGKDVSMKVESPEVAVVAERPMYFNYKNQGWTGGHNAMGSIGLDDRWYFAEGTTREGFDTYLCVQNPHKTAGTAEITYIMGDGSTSKRDLALPATSRQTVRVNDDVGADKDVSIVLDSTLPVLAERPMYFDYHGIAPGGHVAMGAGEPRNSWYFAEGTTRPGFEEWLSLQNPGSLDTGVKLSYMLGDGSVVEQDVSVPAHTRVTVDVKLAVGEGKDVSVAVWGALGIIAERPMYFVPTAETPAVQPGGTNVLGL